MARASALQAEGRRFDSDYLHKKALKVFPECFFVCMVFYRKCFLFCPHYSVSRIGLRHPIIYVISVHGLAPAFRHQYCSWHSPHMIVPVQNFPLGEFCICFLSAYLSRRGQRIQSCKGRLGMLINVASDFIKPGKALLPATGSRNEECQKTNSQKIFHRPDYKSIRTFPCPDAYYKMVTQTQKLPFWVV